MLLITYPYRQSTLDVHSSA